jgi:hypothetical protein
MSNGIVAELQESRGLFGARRSRRGLQHRELELLSRSMDLAGARVHARCAEELQYDRKRTEYHFRNSTIIIRYGWKGRKSVTYIGIASKHPVEGTPLDCTYVAVLADGRVLLTSRIPDERECVLNAMRPIEFVRYGYSHEEAVATLKAVLHYLEAHA